MEFAEDTVDKRILSRKKNELTPQQKAKRDELAKTRCRHWRTDGRGCTKFGETASCTRCIPGKFYVPSVSKEVIFMEDSTRIEG